MSWETDVGVTSIENLIKLSKTKVEFLENLDLLPIEKIRQIEVCTRGQCCNEQWYVCRKGVITTSKAHQVTTKMKKVRKGGGGVVNIWSLKEKTSGMIFVNPNIPALKYGKDMEIEAVNTFAEYITTTTRTALFQNVDWFSTKPCRTSDQVQTG